MKKKIQKTNTNLTRDEGDLRAIRHLKESVARGKHWYLALLESICYWNSTEERYQRRNYKYLIAGEAFDWLLLAERLCAEIKDYIPEEEMLNLLFYDRPPVELPKEELKNLMGESKYKGYLNFSYSILLEDWLILAVIQEIRKQRRSIGSYQDEGISDTAYKLIYGLSEEELWCAFMKQKGYQRRKNISLGEVKEFLFWLFRYRQGHSDSSRFASDTKKALLYLQNMLTLKKRLA